MIRTYDKPLLIQRRQPDGSFADWWRVHAHINRTGGGESFDSGARRDGLRLTFEMAYFSSLTDIFLDTQSFRIIYNGAVFYVEDYDDYMERHVSVRLEGVCTGERYGQP